jgi:hypothetical protein
VRGVGVVTSPELALLIVCAAWLTGLTFVFLLVVRQLGLMTARLSFAAPHVSADDIGMSVGATVPEEIVSQIGANGSTAPSRTLIFFSATCGDCRSIAERLREDDLGEALVLISGDPTLSGALATLLPDGAPTVFEPDASRIAHALGVDTVPFGLRVDEGVVSAKALLTSATDLDRLGVGVERRSVELIRRSNNSRPTAKAGVS